MMVEVETKNHKRLACKNDLEIAFFETKPRIFQLVATKQQLKTHRYNNAL